MIKITLKVLIFNHVIYYIFKSCFSNTLNIIKKKYIIYRTCKISQSFIKLKMIDSLKINIKSKIQRLLFIPPFIPIINQSQVNQMQRPEYYEIIPSKNHTPPSFKQKRASLIPCSLHRNFIVPRWMPNRATVWQGQFRSVWNALLPNPEALSSSLHGCSCATNGFVMVHCIRTCTLPPLSQHFVRSVSSSSLFLPWRFVLFLFPFLSFSLSRDRFDRSLSRSYYFNRFCCAIATREFENCVYFLSFLGRFEICYFSIVCKFYIACYTLLEMKMECLNGNWEMEIGENL